MIPLLLLWAVAPPVFDRAVPDPSVNYIVLDVATRQVVASRWPEMETPIPVGSLVKPFLALAYNAPFPEFECKGTANGCWRPHPHGRLSFIEALAQSCNAYFLNLARHTDAEALRRVSAKYGITPPSENSPETRIGLGTGWKISPLALTRAYAELAARSGEPAVQAILNGLERSAVSGTSSAIGAGVLAKTGTAPCAAEMRHAGDGYSLALYPAEAPRVAILVRVHNVPGAHAAATAAQLLKIIRSGK
jgi:cell division protein FtsI/penicillin-binding protein 2